MNQLQEEEYKINLSISILKDLAKKLGKCPTTKELDNSLKLADTYRRRTLETKLGMKYNDICRKYIGEYTLNIDRDKRPTKEEIKNEIIRIYEKEGSVPDLKHLNKVGKYRKNMILRVFGTYSYNEILKYVGLKHEITPPIVRNEDVLIKDFIRLFEELDRIPYSHEMCLKNGTASYNTYCKYFGSIDDLCKRIGISYADNFKCGAGIISYDRNGDLCKSNVELLITNYFIENNINYKKEYRYSHVLKDEQPKPRRFDWMIKCNKKKYYIEYFGMYHRRHKGKPNLSGRYLKKTRKKIKDLYKAGVYDNCIFIFPWDIQNKSLDEIFGNYINIINKAS